MSDTFWIILMVLGYLTMGWITTMIAVASSDWKGENEGMQYLCGGLWPLSLTYYVFKALGLSANAVGERIKENRRMR
jgi:hypothetical protein